MAEAPERPKRPPRKKNTPAVPLFPDAYLYDTRHLSLEEHGAYLLLLLAAWRMPDCALPDDDARLARILSISGKRWAKLKPTIMQFWHLENGHWTQKRLLQERRYVAFRSEVNASNSRAYWNGEDAENKGEGESERISKRSTGRKSDRNPPQPLPLETLPLSDDNGPAADEIPEGDEPPFDPVKALFDTGIRVLGAAGNSAKTARSLIGMWRKDYGDDGVALALAAAEAQHISQPLEWIPKWLASRKASAPKPAASSGHTFMDAIAADYLPTAQPKKGNEK
jgi:uncharacterized protein YdaU (DUF1376 family)